MRICFVSPEIFSWGYYGGFGFLTRTLGRELSKRGHEVSVVTVRRGDQGEVEELDGMTVYGFPSLGAEPGSPASLLSKIKSTSYYKRADAEIYHSQEVSYNTVAAQRALPGRIHVITFQDPYDLDEWRRISAVDPRYRLTPAFRARLLAENRILAGACHRADALFAQARFLIERAVRLFRLGRSPAFLPNPVDVPRRAMKKAEDPQVCFLSRWDPQKRAEVFFELAKRFPDVEFVAMGRSHNPEEDTRLRGKYGRIRNLRLVGFVSEEEKSSILERSWALVNTSVREALPISFLESLAHETPIISGENPDGLTDDYGYWVREGDYDGALRSLLSGEDWRDKGKLGRRLIEEVYESEKVVDRHVEIYRRLMEGRR